VFREAALEGRDGGGARRKAAGGDGAEGEEERGCDAHAEVRTAFGGENDGGSERLSRERRERRGAREGVGGWERERERIAVEKEVMVKSAYSNCTTDSSEASIASRARAKLEIQWRAGARAFGYLHERSIRQSGEFIKKSTKRFRPIKERDLRRDYKLIIPFNRAVKWKSEWNFSEPSIIINGLAIIGTGGCAVNSALMAE